MKRCLITGEAFDALGDYSPAGLRALDRNLKSIAPLPYTAEEQRRESLERAGKTSVQGVQYKWSAVLRVTAGAFEIVDSNGRFIIKPPSLDYAELPENESLTMRLAEQVGIEVPVHGLVRARDGSLSYFVRRFDRAGRARVPLEDFAQLSGKSRDTKYNSSMEKVAAVVDSFCTFPAIERVKLFERTLFSFLVGNEDMHLKNFSLISRNGRVELSPGYDFLNTTIALKNAQEEMALPLDGRRARLTRRDFFDYFARERLGINAVVINEIEQRFQKAFSRWNESLAASFLSEKNKAAYAALLAERKARIF